MKQAVVILGTHPIARGMKLREDADVWVFNESAGTGWTDRITGVFQMHTDAIWKNPKNINDPGHFEWLKAEHDYPIWMMEAHDEIPASIAYPIEAICCDLLGNFHKGTMQPRYFTSSVAYALALAIYMGYPEIEMYGVEMETNTEYGYQRDGVYFWLGVAVGRGVQVRLMEITNLFTAPLYGYEGDVELHKAEFEERAKEIEEKAATLRKILETANERLRAALEMVVKADEQELKDLAVKNYSEAIRQQSGVMVEFGALNGALYLNKKYIERAKAMDEAAGEHVFVRQEFEFGAASTFELTKKREAVMNNMGGQATTGWKALKNSENGSREKLLKDYMAAHEKYAQAAYEYGQMLGVHRENVRYLEKLDELIKAAGGKKAVEAILG